MKSKLLIILLVSTVTVSTVQAQLIRGFGFKGGAVSANQSWEYKNFVINLPTETRWGLDAGVFVEALNLPYFSILGEFHYVQKGFTTTVVVTTPEGPEGTIQTIRPRVDYVSIPILAKLRFETAILTPYVYAGPRFDILLSTKNEVFGSVYDKLKTTDAGTSLGVGIEVPTAFGSGLLAEFRYSPSFNDVFTNQNLSVKNKSFELLVGIRF